MVALEQNSPIDPARRKSPTAFRTIAEVSGELDVPAHVLRFWESKFPQIKPLKRRGGRRYYRPEDVSLLRHIRTLLYTEGYTIRGAQKLLREVGGRSAELPAAGAPFEQQSDSLADILVELELIRDLLRGVDR